MRTSPIEAKCLVTRGLYSEAKCLTEGVEQGAATLKVKEGSHRRMVEIEGPKYRDSKGQLAGQVREQGDLDCVLSQP